MKRTDLEKLKGAKINNRVAQAGTPDRYGRAMGTPASRREQRKRDQAQGLVPFAVKLDGALADRIRALAAARGVIVDALVDELLRKGLEA